MSVIASLGAATASVNRQTTAGGIVPSNISTRTAARNTLGSPSTIVSLSAQTTTGKLPFTLPDLEQPGANTLVWA